MKKAILATKVGMTQVFNEDGVLTPVTVLQAGPCVVTQVKTEDNDGYAAVQVGFMDKRETLVNMPDRGKFDKADLPYMRFIREFRFENAADYNVKDEIKADIFEAGDKIDVSAVSKGKGFQGVIKRFGQRRGPWDGSSFTDMQVPAVPHLIREGYSRENGRADGVKVTNQERSRKVDVDDNLILVKGVYRDRRRL